MKEWEGADCVLSEPDPHGLKGSESSAILTGEYSVLNSAWGDDNLSKACGTHKNCIKQNQKTQQGHHLPACLSVQKFHRLPRSQTDVPV